MQMFGRTVIYTDATSVTADNVRDSIVNVNTHTGEASTIRYGAGTNYVRCHETTSLDEIDNKYYRGEFPQA